MSRKRRKVGCNKESMKKQLVAGIVVAVAWILSARADVDSFLQERLDDWLRSSMIAPGKGKDHSYFQKRLERWLYFLEPEDWIADDTPPDPPLRHMDALPEFKDFFEMSGWTTNQFVEGLILAVTNNLAAAKRGDEIKCRIVGRATWKLSEINMPAVTNFFRRFNDTDDTLWLKQDTIPAMFYYTSLEPEVMSYMRSLCVRTNIYCNVESSVMSDMFETLETMPDNLKPAATNRVAKYMYFAIRNTTQGVIWQDYKLSGFIPEYANSIQRLSAMQYVAATIANPRARASAQAEVARLSAIPTNQLNNISWIAEDVTGGK